jgi:hypothetical protein
LTNVGVHVLLLGLILSLIFIHNPVNLRILFLWVQWKGCLDKFESLQLVHTPNFTIEQILPLRINKLL